MISWFREDWRLSLPEVF